MYKRKTIYAESVQKKDDTGMQHQPRAIPSGWNRYRKRELCPWTRTEDPELDHKDGRYSTEVKDTRGLPWWRSG